QLPSLFLFTRRGEHLLGLPAHVLDRVRDLPAPSRLLTCCDAHFVRDVLDVPNGLLCLLRGPDLLLGRLRDFVHQLASPARRRDDLLQRPAGARSELDPFVRSLGHLAVLPRHLVHILNHPPHRRPAPPGRLSRSLRPTPGLPGDPPEPPPAAPPPSPHARSA